MFRSLMRVFFATLLLRCIVHDSAHNWAENKGESARLDVCRTLILSLIAA